MRAWRRTVPILVLLLCVWIAAPAAAAGEPVSGITILFPGTELGLDTDIQLTAHVTPQSAAERSVTWQVMTAAEAFADVARTKLDCPYILGETGPDAFDCSGFVTWCINQTGVPYTHMNSFRWRTADTFMRIEDMTQLAVGDILVFTGDTASSSGHVGIFLGGSSMIDASDSRGRVRITDDVFPDKGYWSMRFVAAYRIFPDNGTADVTATGVLRASAPGSIAVKATANDGSGVCAYRFLTVLDMRGMGTAAQPYLVDSVASLSRVRDDLSACYRLAGNVDLSSVEGGFLPIGTPDAPFAGVFDGAGYAVTGLRQQIAGEGEVYGGLFGVLRAGTVENLAIDGVEISVASTAGAGAAGAVAGLAEGGSAIRCCSTSGSVSADVAGGAVGMLGSNSAVQNCYSLTSVSGTVAGGVAGRIGGPRASVVYSYSLSSVAGATAGGVAGVSRGKIERCYYLNRMTAGVGSGKDPAKPLSAAALTQKSSFSGFDFDSIWAQDADSAYPYPTLAVLLPRDTLTVDDPRFAGGNGLPYAPYRIATEQQLRAVGEEPAAWFLLEQDVTLDAPFTPVGTVAAPFSGVFDGGGHTLWGVTTAAAGYAGMFGVAEHASISDLTLANVSVTGAVAGALSGLVSDTTVTNVTVSGTVTGSETSGGIAGVQTGGRACGLRADASVTSQTGAAGGLFGISDGDSSRCYAAGTVTGETAGGLFGTLSGTVQDAFFTGVANGGTAGGIAGVAEKGARMAGCYSAGTVMGTVTGGVRGAGEGSVNRCCYLVAQGADPGGDGAPLTAADMTRQQSYSKFDFRSVWTMAGSAAYPYPELIDTPYLPGLITGIRLTGPGQVFIGMLTAYAVVTEPVTDAPGAVVFSVEEGTGSATVDASGALTGVSAGEVTLVCTAADGGGAVARLAVTVLPTQVTTLAVDGPSLLAAGDSTAYAAVTHPDAVDAALVQWESSDPDVLKIDAQGNAVAVFEGTAVLTARLGSLSAELTVTVRTRASELIMSEDALWLAVGYSRPLTCTVVPDGALDTPLFTSSDRMVATVDNSGLVTAAAVGTAVITATGGDGLSCACTVTVVPYALRMTQPRMELTVGQTAALPVAVEAGFGYTVPELVYHVYAPAMKVSADGELTAKQAGLGIVTVAFAGEPDSAVRIPVLIKP